MDRSASCWVLGWAGLPLDCGYTGLEPGHSHRAAWGPKIKPRSASLPLRAWKTMSPMVSLGRQDWLWLRGARAKLQDHHFGLYNQTKAGGPSSSGTNGHASCGSWTVTEKDWSWVTGHFRVYIQDWVAGLLPHGQVWLLSMVLADGAGGYSESTGQRAISGSVARTVPVSLPCGCGPAFLKWASLVFGLHGVLQLPTRIQSSHKGAFVQGWLPKYCCYREMWVGALLFCHLAGLYLFKKKTKTYFFILKLVCANYFILENKKNRSKI